MEARDSTVDELRDRIERTVRSRQALRAAGAGELELERNRRELVRLQWQLAYALGRVHAGAAA